MAYMGGESQSALIADLQHSLCQLFAVLIQILLVCTACKCAFDELQGLIRAVLVQPKGILHANQAFTLNMRATDGDKTPPQGPSRQNKHHADLGSSILVVCWGHRHFRMPMS